MRSPPRPYRKGLNSARSRDRRRYPPTTDPDRLTQPAPVRASIAIARRRCRGLGVPLWVLAGAQLAQRLEQLVEFRHLDVLLNAAVRQLLPEHLVQVEHRRRVVDVDL